MDFAYWLAAPFCDAPREARFCAGEVCTALCGRCLGLFAAFLIGALLLRVTEPREDRARVALDERALQLAVAGLLVAAFDAFALDSALPIRLATGAAGGFGLAVLAGAASAARRGGVPLHLGPSRRNQALTAGALCLTAVAAALFLALAANPSVLAVASVAGVWGILLLGLHVGLALLTLGTRRVSPQ